MLNNCCHNRSRIFWETYQQVLIAYNAVILACTQIFLNFYLYCVFSCPPQKVELTKSAISLLILYCDFNMVILFSFSRQSFLRNLAKNTLSNCWISHDKLSDFVCPFSQDRRKLFGVTQQYELLAL